MPSLVAVGGGGNETMGDDSRMMENDAKRKKIISYLILVLVSTQNIRESE